MALSSPEQDYRKALTVPKHSFCCIKMDLKFESLQ